MVHRQTNHLVGHTSGYRQILRACAVESAIGAEIADQWVEIPATQDALLPHFEIELVASHAVFLGVDKDGEIAVIVLDTGEVVPK